MSDSIDNDDKYRASDVRYISNTNMTLTLKYLYFMGLGYEELEEHGQCMI